MVPKLIGAAMASAPRSGAAPSMPQAALSVAATSSASAGRRRSARRFAASVGVIRPALRRKSAAPTVASKSDTRLLITDFDRLSRAAVAETVPSSITVRKVSISSREYRIGASIAVRLPFAMTERRLRSGAGGNAGSERRYSRQRKEAFEMNLSGIHHLTAITADAPANNRFYTDTLGLRRVKKTVNQDDSSSHPRKSSSSARASVSALPICAR